MINQIEIRCQNKSVLNPPSMNPPQRHDDAHDSDSEFALAIDIR